MSSKASELAWKYADAEGLLKPGITPRCKVFVDGALTEYVCLANLTEGYVEVLRTDWFKPGDEEIPRQRVEGFIDIELIEVQA